MDSTNGLYSVNNQRSKARLELADKRRKLKHRLKFAKIIPSDEIDVSEEVDI